MTTAFFLGTHQPHWLRHMTVPLFISRRRLEGYRSLPRAMGKWALDSGGFSELQMYGTWKLAARPYADLVRRFRDEVGNLSWAAPQDWMCEATMLAKTGLTVAKHQKLTIKNYLELRSIDPSLPIIPVLQGWTIGEYERHADAYERAGVDLAALDLVGVGTVCRRQNTTTASNLMSILARRGLRLHGFGFKRTGLGSPGGRLLVSADSMAWSFDARRSPPLPECVGLHKNCANCERFALEWLEGTMAIIGRSAPRSS